MKIIKPSVIYLRKSQEDKELETIGEKETLARHKKILVETAEKHGLNVTKIYEEILSGDSIEERPEMRKLITDLLSRKYENLLVVELQRLSRGSTKDQGIILEALEISGTKIVTPDRIYDPLNEYDLEAIEFGLYMSRREYKFITKRMRSGVIQSVKEGNFIAPHPPFGYDVLNRGRRDRTLQPNEYAPLVKQIYEWRLNENMSPWDICVRLDGMGIPTRNKKKWANGTVNHILRNPVYLGKIQWNNIHESKEYNQHLGLIEKTHRKRAREDVILVEGKHEGIIEPELFEAVGKTFRETPPADTKKLRNMFAGLIKCARCGKSINLHVYKSKRNARFAHTPSVGCRMKTVVARKVTEPILQKLKEHAETLEFEIQNFNQDGEIEKYRQQKATLEAEIEKLKRKRANIFDLMEEGAYTRADFIERKGMVDESLEKINSTLEAMEEPTQHEIKLKSTTFAQVIHSLENPEINIAKKNRLLKSVIERVDYEYDGEKIELDIFFK
jgi:DNA invertase Pin-like site-specific DNA recombinase